MSHENMISNLTICNLGHKFQIRCSKHDDAIFLKETVRLGYFHILIVYEFEKLQKKLY